uniref:Uncharacterized protein n=1 Tax=Romanomermis culicivorax TaxID=13658 RepID=A0A915KWE9_ROMCU
YNVKRVLRIHELDQWFEATFGCWPTNPKEPRMCGFDIKKVLQDKVAALFKRREVDNPMGNKFA